MTLVSWLNRVTCCSPPPATHTIRDHNKEQTTIFWLEWLRKYDGENQESGEIAVDCKNPRWYHRGERDKWKYKLHHPASPALSPTPKVAQSQEEQLMGKWEVGDIQLSTSLIGSCRYCRYCSLYHRRGLQPSHAQITVQELLRQLHMAILPLHRRLHCTGQPWPKLQWLSTILRLDSLL